jgi:hypothetical protein
MAGRVAKRWLTANLRDEHRLTVYQSGKGVKNLPGMLRSFRDGKLKIGSVDPIRDLGIKLGFEQVEIWSADKTGLLNLDTWLREAGCETSGIW